MNTLYTFLDSAYTERYMGSPDAQSEFLPGHGNYDGYKSADLTKQVQDLKGKNLFFVHGTKDNNVHFQQSKSFANLIEEGKKVCTQLTLASLFAVAILTKAMVENNILFRQQVRCYWQWRKVSKINYIGRTSKSSMKRETRNRFFFIYSIYF